MEQRTYSHTPLFPEQEVNRTCKMTIIRTPLYCRRYSPGQPASHDLVGLSAFGTLWQKQKQRCMHPCNPTQAKSQRQARLAELLLLQCGRRRQPTSRRRRDTRMRRRPHPPATAAADALHGMVFSPLFVWITKPP